MRVKILSRNMANTLLFVADLFFYLYLFIYFLFFFLFFFIYFFFCSKIINLFENTLAKTVNEFVINVLNKLMML